MTGFCTQSNLLYIQNYIVFALHTKSSCLHRAKAVRTPPHTGLLKIFWDCATQHTPGTVLCTQLERVSLQRLYCIDVKLQFILVGLVLCFLDGTDPVGYVLGKEYEQLSLRDEQFSLVYDVPWGSLAIPLNWLAENPIPLSWVDENPIPLRWLDEIPIPSVPFWGMLGIFLDNEIFMKVFPSRISKVERKGVNFSHNWIYFSL
jgi:hypothetical protein